MNQLSFVYVIYIASTPEKVWEALTNENLTAEYWAHKNVSDWKTGSKWEHRRAKDFSKIDVAGEIIESVPPKKLVISWAEGGNVENKSRVSFEIEPVFDTVRLTVTHEELDSATLRGITQGWPAVLSSLKTFLESGHGLDLIRRWTEER